MFGYFLVCFFFQYQICSDLNDVIKIVRIIWCCLGATVDLVVVSIQRGLEHFHPCFGLVMSQSVPIIFLTVRIIRSA